MYVWRGSSFVHIAFALSVCSPALAFAEPTDYVLIATSDVQDGCLDPCKCPIRLFGLQGSFVLTPVAPSDGFDMFSVTDVQWTIVAFDGTVRAVTGGGTYKIRSIPVPTQCLELDLSIEEAPLVHFDSGLVPVQAEFPVIQVAIAMNGFYCYDNVLTVHTEPQAVAIDSSTWGRVKALYGN